MGKSTLNDVILGLTFSFVIFSMTIGMIIIVNAFTKSNNVVEETRTPSPTLTDVQQTPTSQSEASSTPTLLPPPLTKSPTPSFPDFSPKKVLEAIKERKEIVVGVRFDAPPFGSFPGFSDKYQDKFEEENYCLPLEGFEDDVKGFDINLVREFARRWFQDPNNPNTPNPPNPVKFVPVPANKRIDCLQRVDFIVAAFTDKKCDDSSIKCSQVYFQDRGDFLVRADLEAQISDFCDINGKTVAILKGTTAKGRLEDRLSTECGYSNIEIVEYDNREEAIKDVENHVNKVDMYVTNRSILEQYISPKLVLANIDFQEYSFKIATRENNKIIIDIINQTLQAMKRDGSYDALYKKSKEEGLGFGCNATLYKLETPIADQDILKEVRSDDPVTDDCP